MGKIILTLALLASLATAAKSTVKHVTFASGSVPIFSGENRIGEDKYHDVLEGKQLTGWSYQVESCTLYSTGADCKDAVVLVDPHNRGNQYYKTYAYQYQNYLVTQFYGFLETVYSYDISAEIVISVDFEYTVEGSFDALNRVIYVSLENTVWADIHYKINGGPQLNYRMSKNGDSFSQEIFQSIKNGDVIEYYTTSQNADGSISESSWSSIEVSGLVDLISTNFKAGVISLAATQNLDWVDVHYSINGSSQYNYRMSGAQKDFTFTIPQTLNPGDTIYYSFTYSLNGRAENSEVYSAAYTQDALSTFKNTEQYNSWKLLVHSTNTHRAGFDSDSVRIYFDGSKYYGYYHKHNATEHIDLIELHFNGDELIGDCIRPMSPQNFREKYTFEGEIVKLWWFFDHVGYWEGPIKLEIVEATKIALP